MAKEKAYQVTIVRGKWIKIENEISQTKSNLLEIIRPLFFFFFFLSGILSERDSDGGVHEKIKGGKPLDKNRFLISDGPLF